MIVSLVVLDWVSLLQSWQFWILSFYSKITGGFNIRLNQLWIERKAVIISYFCLPDFILVLDNVLDFIKRKPFCVIIDTIVDPPIPNFICRMVRYDKYSSYNLPVQHEIHKPSIKLTCFRVHKHYFPTEPTSMK